MQASVTVRDHTKAMFAALQELRYTDVLVGIPEERASREGETITNAQLAYIHTHGVRAKSMREEMQPTIDETGKYSKAYEMYVMAHGSPLYAVPSRPIIEAAIEYPENQAMIARELAKALQAIAAGNQGRAERYLQQAGEVAMNAVRDWFEHPANGWPPNSDETAKRKGSERPLVDTGALRQAITYVVRDKRKE